MTVDIETTTAWNVPARIIYDVLTGVYAYTHYACTHIMHTTSTAIPPADALSSSCTFALTVRRSAAAAS